MFRTFKYSMLHSTEKKKTILKIKTRITIKSRAKNKEKIWIQNKVNLNQDFCSN